MQGLIPCDGGCKTLIERHVLRCIACERRLGPHPDASGQRGMAPRRDEQKKVHDKRKKVR